MDLQVSNSVSVLTVLLQGLLSFFSPCVLPLLPVYIGYLSGGTGSVQADGERHFDQKRVLLNTVCFVIGIGFSFLLLGLGMRAVGRFFSGNQLLFARIGGILVILFGLYQLGLFGTSATLSRERRLPFRPEKMAMSPLTALFMGFVFSFAWTPCIGPVLSGALLMAASAKGSAAGFLLIGVYTLGFSIPFLLTGIFTTSILSALRRHRGVVRFTTKISGALLILMGLLMLSGHMNSITGYLSRFSAIGQGGGVTVETEAKSESEPGSELGAKSESEPETESENADAAETGGSAQTLYPAPDFSLMDQYGNVHVLSDYRGKVVFLNFWATWCPPCRAEMPDIQALYEETQEAEDPDLVILGVAFPGFGDELSEKGIKTFLEENGYTYPTLMDPDASLMSVYYITAYPTTFMIDRDGNLFGYVPGSMSRDIMDDIIRQTKDGRTTPNP